MGISDYFKDNVANGTDHEISRNEIAGSPCCLGGCEHIFCSQCCGAYLGMSCPVCKIPAHAKDAEVNRQLFSIASLCRQLRSVLTDGGDVHETQADNELQQTPNQSTPGTVSHGYGQQTPIQSAVCLESHDCHVTKESTSHDQHVMKDTRHTPEPKILRKSKRKHAVTKNSSVKLGKTAEEIAENVPVQTSTRSNKNKKKTKKQIPVDQTTLTQFYEYDSDNGDALEMVVATDPDQTNNKDGKPLAHSTTSDFGKHNNGLRSGGRDHGTTAEAVKDGKIVADCIRLHNKGLRSVERGHSLTDEVVKGGKNKSIGTSTRISQTKNDGISKTVTRLRRKSDCAPKEKTPISKHKKGQSQPTSVSPLPGQTPQTPANRLPTIQGRKPTNDVSTMPALSPALETPRNKSRRSRSAATPPTLVSMTTPVSARSRSVLAGSPVTPARSQGTPIMSGSLAINKRNAKGETPLQVAAIKNDVAKVRELLEAGANPNVRDNAGWTPLVMAMITHEACNHGYLGLARLLLDDGAMINVPGLENDSPLHDAVSNGRIECVKLLVSRGASLTLRNLHGWTPQDFARTKSTEMQRALQTLVIAEQQSDDQVLDVLEFQQPCLLGTALSRDQKIVLQKCANILQAKLVEDCTAEVTHVITSCNQAGMCPRTIKYLHGVLMGKWILNMDWVDTCLQLQSRVLEEAFEVQGTSTCPDSKAPYRGRMNRKCQLPGLFDGCQFYFHGKFENSTPEKDDLVTLVKAGSGKILTREPKPGLIDETSLTVPYHASASGPGLNCCIFVVYETGVKFTSIRTPVMCSVPLGWILDSAAQFKLVDLPVM